jgi:superfamily II DNA/RNA helicase
MFQKNSSNSSRPSGRRFARPAGFKKGGSSPRTGGASSGRPSGPRPHNYAPRPHGVTSSAYSQEPRPSSVRSFTPHAHGPRPSGYAPRTAGKFPSHVSYGRPPQKGGFRRGPQAGGRGRGERIDFNRFINKAVITEKVEHFIPEHRFTNFKISDALKNAITAKGYEFPTPIQDKIIPHILIGADVVGIANTGTGKTAAFLIPLIEKISTKPAEKILIMVPTRELALQIDEEFKGFARGMRLFSVCCVGGMSIGKQISDLRRQHNVVIGTPGRLKDLIARRNINPADFATVVLDEADRMLDMGFINDMKFIMGKMPTPRHTLFFSATLSSDIQKLIKDFLVEPVSISVKTQETARNVEQDIIRVAPGADKLDILHDLLNKEEFSKVLIFGRTKHGVEKLSQKLIERGFKAESIHGDKNHTRRQRALRSFKENHVQVLVATDVAARGLDIADITHVINYDLPQTYDDYIHRIGRTGRGSKNGKALTFIE